MVSGSEVKFELLIVVSGSEVKFELLRQLNIDSEKSVGFNTRCKCARRSDGARWRATARGLWVSL